MLYQLKRWKNEDHLNKIGLHQTLCIFNLNDVVNTHLQMFFEQRIILMSQIKDK